MIHYAKYFATTWKSLYFTPFPYASFPKEVSVYPQILPSELLPPKCLLNDRPEQYGGWNGERGFHTPANA